MDKCKKIFANVPCGKRIRQRSNAPKLAAAVKASKIAAAQSKEATDTKLPCIRIVQNFHLVWLDGSIDELTNEDSRNIILKLRKMVNTVNTFTDVNKCIEFISAITEAETFIISSGSLGQTIVPMVHDMAQVRAIYIFCENKAHHEQWAAQWPKVKGVFKETAPIYEGLKQTTQEYDKNSVSMSFIAPNTGNSIENLEKLDPTFMYAQILREILLTTEFEQKDFVEFITYCREQFVGNIDELKNIDKLEREYRAHAPIWWYTYDCFLYSMLTRALGTMKFDLIIKMGFFIRDLHKHITQMHSEQYPKHGHMAPFTVFRGQGMSSTNFDQLVKTEGGLISFNNFLSTSLNRDVALASAISSQNNRDSIGVLFQITIDLAIPSTPFASIRDISHYQRKQEILFSMHSIFHIGDIKHMDDTCRLWRVDLTLTSDNDPRLYTLTEHIRTEIFPDEKGWIRLGRLLTELGQFNKAQDVYDILLKQTTGESWQAYIYHHLGTAKQGQEKYKEAVVFYEQSIKINRKCLPAYHLDLGASYSNIGSVYFKLGEYSKALSSHQNALEIFQKSLPADHPDVAKTNENIAMVSFRLKEHIENSFTS